MLMPGAAIFDAEEIAHLIQGDEKSGPCHEADHHGFRDVAREIAKANTAITIA